MRKPVEAVLYQQAVSSLLKFWHINGQCKYCPYRADVKQLIEQQMAIKGVRVLLKKNSEVRIQESESISRGFRPATD